MIDLYARALERSLLGLKEDPAHQTPSKIAA